jgi:hypothetical protein
VFYARAWLLVVRIAVSSVIAVGAWWAQVLPIFVICSESHYSVLFGVERSLCGPAAPADEFDLFYYDELGRQDETIRSEARDGHSWHHLLHS